MRSLEKAIKFIKRLPTIVVTAFIFLLFVFILETIGGTYRFFTATNWLNILMQVSCFGIMAVGMNTLMINAQIDLSTGMTASFVSIFIAISVSKWNFTPFWAVVCGILLAVVLNFLVSLIVSQFKLGSFIITLGASMVYRGLGLLLCESREVRMDGQLSIFKTNLLKGAKDSQGLIMNFPIYVAVFLVASIIMWWILRYTKYGKRVYAVGANPSSAYLSGINVKKVTITSFLTHGLLVGIGSVMLLARVNVATISLGEGAEMDSIAAAVIGGTLISGGKGNMLETLIGIILMGAITNGMNVLKLRSELQYVVKGVIIIFAIAATEISARKAMTVSRRQLRGAADSSEKI